MNRLLCESLWAGFSTDIWIWSSLIWLPFSCQMDFLDATVTLVSRDRPLPSFTGIPQVQITWRSFNEVMSAQTLQGVDCSKQQGQGPLTGDCSDWFLTSECGGLSSTLKLKVLCHLDGYTGGFLCLAYPNCGAIYLFPLSTLLLELLYNLKKRPKSSFEWNTLESNFKSANYLQYP